MLHFNNFKHYGLPVIEFEDKQYAVSCSHEESCIAAQQKLKETIHCYSPETINVYSKLSVEAIKVLISHFGQKACKELIAT